jgi:hypothetical protein
MPNRNQQTFHIVSDSKTGLTRAIRHIEAGAVIVVSRISPQSEMVAGIQGLTSTESQEA